MANIKDDYVFKLKGGEASTLECVNPFLERREPIVVFFENGRTNIKIGDGKNNYNSLPFISDTNIDINDVQGLAEILHQYEIDLENLDDKIDKIVIDKVYDPNSDNAQSGKAVAEAIETTVGRKTAEGGEIFNDYDNNQALSKYSTATGCHNIAGSKCFKVIANPVDNGDGTGIYMLDSIEGLETDMRYSAFLETQSVDAGKILSINADTKEVTVDGFVYYPLSPNTDNPETLKIYNSFIITGRPDLGTTDIGFDAFAGGKNNFAQNSHVVTFGEGNYGLGKYATTFGINNISAYNATTLGQGNKNLGATSLVTGVNNTATVNRVFVSGKNNTANGADSFIGGGQDNTTQGEGSAVFNFGNKALGYGSAAFGLENEASGPLSFVAGQNNKPTGKRTAAFGRQNTVAGENSVAFGLENNIGENATNSVAFGESNEITGSHSLTSGINNNIAGAGSIASGYNNSLNSNGGCAFGRLNEVYGTYSGCIGNENIVNKSYSVALNSNNTVNGEKSLAIGSYNTVNGMHSFAGGNSCVIGENAKSTFCLGRVLKSDVPYQTVVGQYNNPNADALFIVGNGVDNASWGRKNAFVVYIDGHAEVQSMGNNPNDKTVVTKGYVDQLKPKKVTFTNGATITAEDNTLYYADTEISSLTIIYPNTDFICSFDFTIASEGDVTVTLPESKYIGGTPSFANGETWEVNIKNGVVIGGLVE